jgi:uncharacterized protein (DUF3084 family)
VDPDIKALLQVLMEGQARMDKSVANLATLLSGHVELSDGRFARLEEAHLRTEQAISNLAANVDRYAAAADARMIRIEENLDGLIRAITREHSNGKGHV